MGFVDLLPEEKKREHDARMRRLDDEIAKTEAETRSIMERTHASRMKWMRESGKRRMKSFLDFIRGRSY